MVINFTTNVGMFQKNNCDIVFEIYVINIRFFVAVISQLNGFERKNCKRMSLKNARQNDVGDAHGPACRYYTCNFCV